MSTRPYRVFVVDDHQLVREGVRRTLEARAGRFDLVGEAAGFEDALRRLPAVRLADIDVLVVDLLLPDGDGVTLCRRLRAREPAVACVLYTQVDGPDSLATAQFAGAAAYVPKSAPTDVLVGAVEAAAGGQRGPADDTSPTPGRWAGSRQADLEAKLEPLTAQERRIFDLIGGGLTNRDIGVRLHLAEKTVRNYVSRMYRKIGISTRGEAASLAGRLAERRRVNGGHGGRPGRA